jgi:hypothetical protein
MRNNGCIFFALLAVLAVVMISFIAYVYINAYSNCDGGTVVKNAFDWPVCIK